MSTDDATGLQAAAQASMDLLVLISASDTVVDKIRILEADPQLNAGTGPHCQIDKQTIQMVVYSARNGIAWSQLTSSTTEKHFES